MKHTPFAENTDDLTVSQLYEKVAELTTKYFQTRNPQLQDQISTFIDYYKQEIVIKEAKIRKEQEENQQNGDLDLDSLIKVS